MLGLKQSDISQSERTGLIVGSGGPSTKGIVAAADITRQNFGPKAHRAIRGAEGDVVDLLGQPLHTWFKTKGVNYSITSACSTSANCIGNAYEMIQWGKQDVMFAGGGEELDWTLSELFDAMGAMSSKFNATPEKASRAYDKSRDGFVISGGGGILILEELEHAKARGAKIYAEIVGYGASADGADIGCAERRRCGALHEAWRLRTSRRRSITSIRTPAPRRRLATSRRSTRSKRFSVSTGCRRSARPNRLPATARARPACTRRSTRC